MTAQEREVMERYLILFGGHWRNTTEDDETNSAGEPRFECDLCHSCGDMSSLMDRIGNRDSARESEFTHFEPYLCESHARELGILW